ncbi:hypothetical protein ACFQ48_05945 [Hymenobacter caeli]|uniref:Uncharacterized protein n=1 Tax=Hymenobacter caeli TaxID=2735894 RepID=A0ABX2FNN9_9BACT|nr:hypothetical protein [Hymenobacter caeli]NRT18577.1 hypothetical protein [Hymenobacter caeli]
MKTLTLLACFLATTSGVFAAGPAGHLGCVRLAGPAPRHEAARPLLRYLIATLHLPDGQALEVQRVLKAHVLVRPSAGELANLLFPVLTEAQFARFQDLADNEVLGPNLNYLASLH